MQNFEVIHSSGPKTEAIAVKNINIYFLLLRTNHLSVRGTNFALKVSTNFSLPQLSEARNSVALNIVVFFFKDLRECSQLVKKKEKPSSKYQPLKVVMSRFVLSKG